MLSTRNSNRIKLVVKLIIIVPISLLVGFHFSDYIFGSVLGMALFVLFSIIIGQIMYKI